MGFREKPQQSSVSQRRSRDERMRCLGEISAGLVHEVGNPLSVIIACVTHLRDLLSDGRISPEQLDQSLEQVEAAAHHIEKVLGGVRLIGRDTQQESVMREDLESIVKMTLGFVRSRLIQQGIELRENIERSGLIIAARPGQITQIILNLLLNAIEAIESQTPRAAPAWIGIELCAHPGRVELKISNSGPGIPAALRDRLMEPYFTTKPRGSGLGLAISLEIARAHGGALFLESGPETCFVLQLPFNENCLEVA